MKGSYAICPGPSDSPVQNLDLLLHKQNCLQALLPLHPDALAA